MDTESTIEDPIESILNATENGAESGLQKNPSKPETDEHFFVPGFESYLGCGYDIFSGYATPLSVKSSIYDFSNEKSVLQPTLDKSMQLNPDQIKDAFNEQPTELKLIYKRPQKVRYTDLFHPTFTLSEVSTSLKSDTKTDINAAIKGSYLGFSANAKASVSKEKARLGTTKIITANAQIVYWTLDLSGFSLSSPPTIRSEVLEDFAESPIKDLINKYGTHLLQKVGIGSKIAHHYTVDSSKFSSDLNIKASISANYDGKAFSAGGSASAEHDTKTWNDKSAVEVNIEMWGASDVQIENVGISQAANEHPLRVLQQGWHNPTLVELYDDSLLPLWEIKGLMTPDRAQAFHDEVKKKLEECNKEVGTIFSGAQPLYLFSKSDGKNKKYRLCKTSIPKLDDEKWTIENDGRPWLLTSQEDKGGMAKLYEYAYRGNKDIVRYETAAWEKLLPNVYQSRYWDEDHFITITVKNEEHYTDEPAWTRTSDTGLGYVYDCRELGGQPPEKAKPVYIRYHKNLLPDYGVLYSNQKNLLWDNKSWIESTEFELHSHERIHIQKAALSRWWKGKSGSWQDFHFMTRTCPFKVSDNFGYKSDADTSSPLFAKGFAHWYVLNSES